MIFKENIKKWREISDFFFSLEIGVEKDFNEGRITKKERLILLNKIKKDWDFNMLTNNPYLKENSTLKKVAESFFKMDNLP